MSKKVQMPNDQRSNSLNPNNSAHSASMNNRSNQLNPNNPEFKGKAGQMSCEEKKEKSGDSQN